MQAVYTVMSVAADVCGRHADVHTLSDEVRSTITKAEAAPYVWVTQWFCAGVSTYMVFIWTLKFNMLFFYKRVVNGLWVEKFIMPVMALVAASFVTIITIQFASCRPYNRMWQIYPDQGGKEMLSRPWSFTITYPWRNTLTRTCRQQPIACPRRRSTCCLR